MYWLVDITSGEDKPFFCFCPLGGDPPNAVIIGLNLLSDKPPNGGILIGAFDPTQDDQSACQAFIERHPELPWSYYESESLP